MGTITTITTELEVNTVTNIDITDYLFDNELEDDLGQIRVSLVDGIAIAECDLVVVKRAPDTWSEDVDDEEEYDTREAALEIKLFPQGVPVPEPWNADYEQVDPDGTIFIIDSVNIDNIVYNVIVRYMED